MRTLDHTHPAVTTAYFLAVASGAMFTVNPILLGLSLLGALLYFLLKNGLREGRVHLLFWGLFLLTALLNPFFSRNGATVLFVMNNRPFTLEAFLYGLVIGASVVSVLYWFRSFTRIMTSDKLLCVCGFFSPRVALVISMSLRYLPLLRQKTKQVQAAQRGLGLYRDDSLVHTVRGGARVWSVMLTWAIENGIVTADSMAARGFGEGRRTRFPRFRFQRSDAILLLVIAMLGTPCVVIAATGGFACSFYPRLQMPALTWGAVLGYACYGALAALPAILELEEALRWKYLQSKI